MRSFPTRRNLWESPVSAQDRLPKPTCSSRGKDVKKEVKRDLCTGRAAVAFRANVENKRRMENKILRSTNAI